MDQNIHINYIKIAIANLKNKLTQLEKANNTMTHDIVTAKYDTLMLTDAIENLIVANNRETENHYSKNLNGTVASNEINNDRKIVKPSKEVDLDTTSRMLKEQSINNDPRIFDGNQNTHFNTLPDGVQNAFINNELRNSETKQTNRKRNFNQRENSTSAIALIESARPSMLNTITVPRAIINSKQPDMHNNDQSSTVFQRISIADAIDQFKNDLFENGMDLFGNVNCSSDCSPRNEHCSSRAMQQSIATSTSVRSTVHEASLQKQTSINMTTNTITTQIPIPPERPSSLLNGETYSRSEKHVTAEMIAELYPKIKKTVREAVGKYLVMNIREGWSAGDVRAHLESFMPAYLHEYRESGKHMETIEQQYQQRCTIFGAAEHENGVAVTAKCRNCYTFFIVDSKFSSNINKCLCSYKPFSRSWYRIDRLYYALNHEPHLSIQSNVTNQFMFVTETALRKWVVCPSISMKAKMESICDTLNLRLERLKPYTHYHYVNDSIQRANRWEVYVICPYGHSTGPMIHINLMQKKNVSCKVCYYEYWREQKNVKQVYRTDEGYSSMRPTDLPTINKLETRTLTLSNQTEVIVGSKCEVAVIIDMDSKQMFDMDEWLLGRAVTPISMENLNSWYTADMMNVTKGIVYDTKVHYTATKNVTRLRLVINQSIKNGYEFRIAIRLGRYIFTHVKCSQILSSTQETELICIYSGNLHINILPVIAPVVKNLKDETLFTVGCRLGRILSDSGYVGKSVVASIVPFEIEVKYTSSNDIQIYTNGLYYIIFGFSSKIHKVPQQLNSHPKL